MAAQHNGRTRIRRPELDLRHPRVWLLLTIFFGLTALLTSTPVLWIPVVLLAYGCPWRAVLRSKWAAGPKLLASLGVVLAMSLLVRSIVDYTEAGTILWVMAPLMRGIGWLILPEVQYGCRDRGTQWFTAAVILGIGLLMAALTLI